MKTTTALLLMGSLSLAGCAGPGQTVQHFNSGKVLPTGLPFSEAVRVVLTPTEN